MHPDHIYGWPIFALDTWMAGRRAPLHVYALPETVRTARMMLRAVGSNTWPRFFPIRYHPIHTSSIGLVFANGEFSVSATQTEHFVPTIAVRITSEESGESIAYSCDTTPQENIVELSRGVKYLFHEATTLDTSSLGHSSAIQAGRQATRAGAEQLVLLHLPPETKSSKWRRAAREEFSGRVHVASDLESFEF
jgi:ribonuclease BN (tRNA processing enzyme)